MTTPHWRLRLLTESCFNLNSRKESSLQREITCLILSRNVRKGESKGERKSNCSYFSCPFCYQSFSIQGYLTTNMSTSHKRRVDLGRSVQEAEASKKKNHSETGRGRSSSHSILLPWLHIGFWSTVHAHCTIMLYLMSILLKFVS